MTFLGSDQFGNLSFFPSAFWHLSSLGINGCEELAVCNIYKLFIIQKIRTRRVEGGWHEKKTCI